MNVHRVVGALAVVGLMIGGSPLRSADGLGTEFYLAFLEAADGGADQVVLEVSGPLAGWVTVTGAGTTLGPLNVIPGAVTSIVLPSDVRLTGSGDIESKGILVTATVPVSVVGFQTESAHAEGYLGIPVDLLDTDYLVASFANTSATAGEFAIVASADATTVTVTSTTALEGGGSVGAIAAGSPTQFVLDRLSAIQFQASGGSGPDLTGTRVTADKPIAVFSGHECATVPAGTLYCEHLVEQMPPSSSWGVQFLVAPLATRTGGDIVRIVASTDNTQVFFGASAPTLQAGEYIDFDLDSSSGVEISSTAPVLVVQYAKGSTADAVNNSDPFMGVIPPVSRFGSFFVGTSLSGFANYVNIVIESDDASGLLLDDLAVTETFTAIGDSGYSWAQVPVSIGAHRVTHAVPETLFGVHAYGFEDAIGYGYPFASKDPDRDADGVDDGEDNCPLRFNPTQADANSDGIGDVCDPRNICSQPVEMIEDTMITGNLYCATEESISLGGPELGGVSVESTGFAVLSAPSIDLVSPLAVSNGGELLAGASVAPPWGCVNDLGCGAQEYCALAPGLCSGAGSCAPKPDDCAAVFDPVCGCDGATYSNECVAAAAGTNLAYAGAC